MVADVVDCPPVVVGALSPVVGVIGGVLSEAAAALCEWVDAVRGGARADAKVTPQPIKGIMPGFQSA